MDVFSRLLLSITKLPVSLLSFSLIFSLVREVWVNHFPPLVACFMFTTILLCFKPTEFGGFRIHKPFLISSTCKYCTLFSVSHFARHGRVVWFNPKGYSSFLRMTLCLIFTTAKLSSISVSEVAVERLLPTRWRGWGFDYSKFALPVSLSSSMTFKRY